MAIGVRSPKEQEVAYSSTLDKGERPESSASKFVRLLRSSKRLTGK